MAVDSFDAAIVLGAMVRPDGSPSPALARRVTRAVQLASSGRAAHLVMTGGAVRHATPEAQVMRALAVAAGIEAHRVVVEDRAVNTITNALLSKAVVEAHGWRRLALVTDASHMPRALYTFRRLGLAVSPVAAWPIGAPRPEWFTAWGREVLALPWTLIRVEHHRRKEPS
jgi:uncharacterized SAM-binding protein YcdF (DUF218 family)